MVHPAANAGASFHAAIISGKVPRDDLADDPDRFADGVDVPIACRRDRNLLAVEPRCPSRHVAEHLDRAADIVAPSVGHRLAIVERFQFGQLVGMTFEQVGQRPDEALSCGGRDPGPGSGLEGAARGGDRKIDIRLIPGRDVGDDFFGRGILDRKGLAAARVNPFAIDQHLMFLGQERGRGCTERRLVYSGRGFIGYGHGSAPGSGDVLPIMVPPLARDVNQRETRAHYVMFHFQGSSIEGCDLSGHQAILESHTASAPR